MPYGLWLRVASHIYIATPGRPKNISQRQAFHRLQKALQCTYVASWPSALIKALWADVHDHMAYACDALKAPYDSASFRGFTKPIVKPM